MKHACQLASLGLVFLLSGCIAPTPSPLPTPPPQTLQTDRWWIELGDKHFDLLVSDALRESLSLQAAKERILQAYATVHNKQALKGPSLAASMGASVQEELKGVESYQDSYTATLSASYEIDIFGRKNDALNAAEASFLASFEALHVSSISLVAELANAWYTLGYKKQSLSLLEEQLDVARKILSIAKLKHQSGKNSITDVWQQEQYIASLKSQRTTLEGDIEAQKRSINLLLGRSALSPLPLESSATLITLPPQPEVGIPATRLLNRPDVKQAYYNLLSSNASLAEAIKNQYPSLNVSLSLSSAKNVTHFSDLLDTILGSAVASLSGTLFDGGSKEALVIQAHALSKERSLSYKQTMLQAFYDVNEALEREKNLQMYLHQLHNRTTLANAILERQSEKYLFGVVEYLSVLNAQQSLQELQQTTLSKHLEQIKYRISLHRSLGGSFIEHDIEKEWRNYAN